MNYDYCGEEWSDAMYAGVSPQEIAQSEDVSVSTVLRVVEKYRSNEANAGYDDD